MLLEEVKCLSM